MANNVSVGYLLGLGFRDIYNSPYSHPTTSSEILSIKDVCSDITIMCLGGGIPTDGTLLLVSCALCLNITQYTSFNQPNFVGSTYWYFYPGLSFGLAPTSDIYQYQADQIDCPGVTNCQSNLRLSWHLDLNFGGWRLGTISLLNSDNTYYKRIFIN